MSTTSRSRRQFSLRALLLLMFVMAALLGVWRAFSAVDVWGLPVPSEMVGGQGVSTTFSRDGDFELMVGGSGNTVVVDRGAVRALMVGGSGNVVTIKPPARVLVVSMGGENNRVKVPAGSPRPTVTTGGSDNVVIEE